MPVYNSAAYLQLAINSVLQQSFTDFELIIVNDGSTDNSELIISSYKDERIVYLKNEQNKGLIYTLNKGIDAARGQYIARMDGDDICLPERLEKQIAYLSLHPQVQVLATLVELINEKGEAIGYWEEDKKAVSARQIRALLPRDNCIAHPTIVYSNHLIKKYRYNASQPKTEDYDLWLRLQADNIPMHKLGEVLVQYRVLKTSESRNGRKNIFLKNAITKRTFIFQQLKKGTFNFFIAKTLFYACLDLVKSLLKEIKKILLPSNAGKLAI